MAQSEAGVAGEAPRPRAMVLSVGGSAAPVVASLNAQRPILVCFFVSPESGIALKGDILDKLTYHPEHHDWIETPSAQDLLECFKALTRELPRVAEKWKVPLAEWVADYTGGTKSMTVALGMATIQTVGRYSYVGGTERTKEGLGVVVDGAEKILHLANPWDVLAVTARQRASLLFSRGRHEAAAEEFEAVAGRVPAAERGIYEALAVLARGYAEWDRFAHGKAQDLLSRGLRTLEPYAAGSGNPTWLTLTRLGREHAEMLRRMGEKGGGRLRVADLIANAQRRGNLEARYNDAVARLYSALEMAARVALELDHGIRTSRVHVDQVPAPLRDEFRRQYTKTDEKGAQFMKLPHYAAYRLLAELKDGLATRYFAREKEVRVLLGQRNSSILAHGDKPIGEKVYQELLPLVCEVAEVRETDLPRFPALPA
jgi:CRISPR-associated protein (TIGR02710 family)